MNRWFLTCLLSYVLRHSTYLLLSVVICFFVINGISFTFQSSGVVELDKDEVIFDGIQKECKLSFFKSIFLYIYI